MLDLEAYLKLLWRWLWAMVIGAIVGAAVALGILLYLGLFPGYEAAVVLTVGMEQGGAELSPGELDMGEILVPSYVVLAELPPVTTAVVENLHLSISASDLAEWRLTAEQSGQTRVFQVWAKDPNPEMAAAIANEVARQLVQSAPLRPNALVQIVAPAKPPQDPSLEPYLIIGIGAVVGIVLAAGVAVFFEVKWDRPQTLTWAASRIHVPLLGTFGGRRRGRSARGKSAGPNPMWWVVIEAFKRALAEQGVPDPDAQSRVLVVTSAERSKGKPVAAVELAQAWATTGSKVVLVDADLRQPTVHSQFGLSNDRGVTTFLAQGGRADELDSLLAASDTDSMMVLPSGPLPGEESALLFEQPWDRLIAALRQRFGMVIVNSPVVRTEPEAVVLAAHADGSVLVIDMGKTGAQAANQAADMLTESGSTLVGAVVSL